jgi:hypothetical protein
VEVPEALAPLPGIPPVLEEPFTGPLPFMEPAPLVELVPPVVSLPALVPPDEVPPWAEPLVPEFMELPMPAPAPVLVEPAPEPEAPAPPTPAWARQRVVLRARREMMDFMRQRGMEAKDRQRNDPKGS